METRPRYRTHAREGVDEREAPPGCRRGRGARRRAPLTALTGAAPSPQTFVIGVDHADAANQQPFPPFNRLFEYTDFFARDLRDHQGDRLPGGARLVPHRGAGEERERGAIRVPGRVQRRRRPGRVRHRDWDRRSQGRAGTLQLLDHRRPRRHGRQQSERPTRVRRGGSSTFPPPQPSPSGRENRRASPGSGPSARPRPRSARRRPR